MPLIKVTVENPSSRAVRIEVRNMGDDSLYGTFRAGPGPTSKEIEVDELWTVETAEACVRRGSAPGVRVREALNWLVTQARKGAGE